LICIIGETSRNQPGSPPWWQLARTALAAWAVQLDLEAHGPLAEYRHRADPAARERLAGQWRAFAEAQIRDRHPQAPPQVSTCQLRQDPYAPPGVPRLADPAFGPLACTCRTCDDTLDQASRQRPSTAHASTAWPSPGHHRAQRQAQDPRQPVAHTPAMPQVSHPGQHPQ
jgi:hypothetical protein